MSDATATNPRLGYRVEVNPRMSGKVEILIHQYQAEGTPGWFSTKPEALQDAAKRMSKLAHELMRQADDLLRDDRGV